MKRRFLRHHIKYVVFGFLVGLTSSVQAEVALATPAPTTSTSVQGIRAKAVGLPNFTLGERTRYMQRPGGVFRRGVQPKALDKDYAKDSAALDKLTAGSVVAIRVAGPYETKKYLRLAKGRDERFVYLQPTGASASDPLCQFEVVRYADDQNWLALSSQEAFGLELAAMIPWNMSKLPTQYTVGFGMGNGDFALESEDGLDEVRLVNRWTGGDLCVQDLDYSDPANVVVVDTDHAKGDGETFSIELVKPAGAELEAGGSSFTCKHSAHWLDEAVFSEKWKFKNSEGGVVKFQAKAAEAIKIIFSPIPEENNNVYKIVIGDSGNTMSGIYRGNQLLTGASLSQNYGVVRPGDEDDMVAGGWPYNGEELYRTKAEGSTSTGTSFGSYWVSFAVEQGKTTIAWGRGDVVHQQECMRYVDAGGYGWFWGAHPIQDLGYVGFGGGPLNVEYADIDIDPAPLPQEETVVVPSGFKQIAGQANHIAVGGENGKGMAVAVGIDNKLYQMTPDTMEDWELIEVVVGKDKEAVDVFCDVAASNDGIVVAVAPDGKAYRRDNKGKWSEMDMAIKGSKDKDLAIDRVAVASKNLILVRDKASGTVYTSAKGAGDWVQLSASVANDFAVAGDGKICAINRLGDIFDYEDGAWGDMQVPVAAAHLAVASEDDLWMLVEHDGSSYLYQMAGGKCSQVAGNDAGSFAQGLVQVRANSTLVMVLDLDGNIYLKGDFDEAVETPKAAPAKKPESKAAAKLGSDAKLKHDGKTRQEAKKANKQTPKKNSEAVLKKHQSKAAHDKKSKHGHKKHRGKKHGHKHKKHLGKHGHGKGKHKHHEGKGKHDAGAKAKPAAGKAAHAKADKHHHHASKGKGKAVTAGASAAASAPSIASAKAGKHDHKKGGKHHHHGAKAAVAGENDEADHDASSSDESSDTAKAGKKDKKHHHHAAKAATASGANAADEEQGADEDKAEVSAKPRKKGGHHRHHAAKAKDKETSAAGEEEEPADDEADATTEASAPNADDKKGGKHHRHHHHAGKGKDKAAAKAAAA